MSSWMIAVVVLLALSGADARLRKVTRKEGTWGQPDLDAVGHALDMVLKQPHLLPEQRKLAEHVADDVKKDIASLVSGGNKITKEAKRILVSNAMKEMTGLEDALSHPEKVHMGKNATQIAAKLLSMQKELAEKKAELKKDEDQMKILSLEKELAVKRMELETLEAQKAKTANAKSVAAQEASKADMVAKLVAMAKNMASKKDHKDAKAQKAQPAQIQAILTSLKKHAQEVNSTLTQMDAANKKVNHDLDAMIKEQPKSEKSQTTMLKGLKRKEERKYEKARVMKKAELAEVNTAIQAIQKGDVKALQKVMKKMKSEADAMKATSGNFLH